MELYFLRCREKTDSKKGGVAKTTEGKLKEASGLLSRLLRKTPLSKILLVGPPLF